MNEEFQNVENNVAKQQQVDNVAVNSNAAINQAEPVATTGQRVGYFFLTLGFAVLCLLLQLAMVIVVLIPAMVIKMATGELDPRSGDFFSVYMDLANNIAPYGIIGYHIVGIIVFGLWYKFSFKKPNRPTIKSGFEAMSGKAILVSIISGIALCFFANATVIVETYAIPSVVESYMKMTEAAGFGVNIFTIIASVVMAPIGEEFLCRGCMLKYGEKSFNNFWIANILQALLFGAIHANFVQGSFAFCIGLVLGWLTRKYRSLIPGMIAHFVVNFSSTTWIGLVFGEDTPSMAVGIILLVVSTAAVVGTLFWANQEKKVAA